MTATGLAFLAGVLSILSPCVLPLLPLVLGAATAEHKFGVAALAAGLALSFTIIGLFVALIGFSIGIDAEVLRKASAVMLIVIGLVMALPVLHMRVAAAAGPVSNWAEMKFGGFSTQGLGGQFALGLLLGAVWSPCVGPTLGAASVLASQGRDIGNVALTMLVFGIGAALPLLILGLLSRDVLMRVRGKLMGAGGALKSVLGILLVLVGVAILTGIDKRVEAQLVEWSPEWLTQLTTRF